MSDDRDPKPGQSARLPRALIWAGVGLAPVAAAVALLGGSNGWLRFAVVLIAVCAVLIGTSILIRSDPVLLGMETEDRVAAETDAVRKELRAEFAAAARVTHHRVQSLQEDFGRLRGAPAVAAPARLAPGGHPVAAGHSTGGRAVVTPSASGWPDGDQAPRPLGPGQISGGRAVVAASAAAPSLQPAALPHQPAALPHQPAALPHQPAALPHQPAALPLQPVAALPHQPVAALPHQPVAAPGQLPHQPVAAPGQLPHQPVAAPGQLPHQPIAASGPIPHQPVAPSGPVPRQRGAVSVPPPSMAPVFRPPAPLVPPAQPAQFAQRGAEYGGSAQPHRAAVPQPGQYGSPRRADEEPSYGGQPGWSDHDPSRRPGRDHGEDPSGWPDEGDVDRGHGEEHGGWGHGEEHGGWGHGEEHAGWGHGEEHAGWGHGEEQRRWPDDEPSFGGQPAGRPARDGAVYGRAEPPRADVDPGYDSQLDWSADELRALSSDDESWSREEANRSSANESSGDDRGPADEPDRPHKRRADVTAIDLGYTGRRSRPGHARNDGPERPDDGPERPDDAADQYWRQPIEPDRR